MFQNGIPTFLGYNNSEEDISLILNQLSGKECKESDKNYYYRIMLFLQAEGYVSDEVIRAFEVKNHINN